MQRIYAVLGGTLLLVGAAVLTALAQAPGEEKDAGGASQGNAGVKTQLSEREKRILELFQATTKQFDKDGRLLLTYNFESKSEELVEDWRPTLAETKMRVRWSRGIEGTITTVEDGILVGDFGHWLHKAVFLADLQVKVDHLSVAQFRPGTILAAVFHNDKKKRSLGVNAGYQAVCLSGWKHAKPPHPRDEKPVPTNVRQTIGYKYDGKVLESYLRDRKTSDTAAVPKFTDGFDSGRVGLAWSGSVQSFIFQVSISGRLDPDWVAEQFGEKGQKGEKPGKKPGKKG